MTTTSFAGLTQSVNRIEIPIIQRDYAQGRQDTATKRIRGEFLDALLKALAPNATSQPLDFVYGEIKDGALIPLDGQQRLTTLFLLHWYLAARLNISANSPGWTGLPKFTYRTRESSTAFCEKLAACRPPFNNPLDGEKDPKDGLGDWLKDQSWFRRAWLRDPTITGMLVTLDGLHGRLQQWSVCHLQNAWDRLIDVQSPAIHFDFLSISNIGSADRQYIRMNARGKPLTEFERFKARFEEMLGHVSPGDRDTFSKQVDGPWTDLLWPLRDSGTGSELDTVIDDEFLRLFLYLSTVVVWKFQVPNCKAEPDANEFDTSWAEPLYGHQDAKGERRAFLFKALDALSKTFVGKNDQQAIANDFAQWFAANTHVSDKVTIFFESINLLAKCVAGFDPLFKHGGKFPLAQTLLFYALLHGWMKDPPVSPNVQRLRVLRNLLLAPDARLERERGEDLLPGVEYLIDHGLPASASPMPKELQKAFSKRQLAEEIEKLALKSRYNILAESLESLEDHPLLRGGLAVFDLDPAQAAGKFTQRATQFHRLFTQPPYQDVAGALLAKGEYGRGSGRWTGYRLLDLGAPDNDEPWRTLFRGKQEDQGKHPALFALMALLDDLAAGGTLKRVMDTYVCSTTTPLDWRYYLVKYEAMREGRSGRYIFSPSGYQGCMLNGSRVHGYYRDPYLFALYRESKIAQAHVEGLLFNSYEDRPRHLVLKQSGLRIQCVDEGWRLNIAAANLTTAQQSVFTSFGVRNNPKIPDEWFYAIPQSSGVDQTDRIELGAKLLSALVANGM